MASNGYSPYNYQNYPQNAVQQYSGYQTAPSASAPVQQQNARPQYQQQQQQQQQQQPAPAATSQATDYLSTNYANQSYNNQSTTYGRPQDTSVTWTGSTGYGANRETTRGAAEALRNMSNTTYGSGSTQAVGQAGFTPANAASAAAAARYSTSSPAQHQTMTQPQQSHASHSYSQVQQQQSHNHPQTQPQVHAQTQARPRSVNASRTQNTTANRGITSPAMAAGYPSQRAQNTYPQQTQRSQSPAQLQYANTSASAQVTSPRNVPRAPATQTQTQYQDYRPRQLPSVDASRNTPASTVSTNSYNYADSTAATSIPQQPTFVSHSAPPAPEPYNSPTPAVTVDPMAVYNPYTEYERKLEGRRQQEAARAEEERKAEELRKEQERRKAEEEERARQAVEQSAEPKGSSSENPLEAEIRAMMAKMRELNSKDPGLLARIWEEERRAKAPKSPATQNKTPQPAPAQPVAAPPAPSMVQKAPAQPKKAPPRAAPPPRPQSIPMPAAVPPPPPRPATVAASGNTIWPAEKKTQLAGAATAYLISQNPNHQIASDTVLSMLDGNPSYIELCEQLEAMGLKLDRAAFAKNLLTAVPDVNSASRPPAQARAQPISAPMSQRPPAPPAAMIRKVGTPTVAQSPGFATQSPMNGSFPPFPESGKHSNSQSPAPVAQMIPIKPELRPPANKEEAARKRNFSDLIDLTGMDEDDLEPLPKKPNVSSMYSYASLGPRFDDDMDSPAPNFPVAVSAPPPPPPTQVHTANVPPPAPSFRGKTIVQPLEKKKALRRNGYNIATIARDVLLACGRHPEERQLNGHLEILKTTIPQITNESDLSTIRWDIIDPGRPPKGYYKNSSQAIEEDADDEEDSEDEAEQKARARAASQARSATVAPPQPLPPPTNPFAKKRGPGRPRHSMPGNFNATNRPSTPQPANTSAKMSSSAPRPAGGSVGYSAFRAATQYGPDGQPLPRRRGRPVGWRKAIHGSPAALERPSPNGQTGPAQNRHTPSQPSALRNVRAGEQDAITISSSPSASKKEHRFQSYKCKWHNCKADLHNLETLRAHVFKVHRKETLRGTLDCLWGDCGREVTDVSNVSSMRVEKHTPFSFTEDAKWKEHLELRHFSPLKWEFGDGPASGLSDPHGSDHYLSDAQGRRVTPLITVRDAAPKINNEAPMAGRGRGKHAKEQEAREALNYLVQQKRALGGSSMDRDGVNIANAKRRRGFVEEDQTEDEFVDAADWGDMGV